MLDRRDAKQKFLEFLGTKTSASPPSVRPSSKPSSPPSSISPRATPRMVPSARPLRLTRHGLSHPPAPHRERPRSRNGFRQGPKYYDPNYAEHPNHNHIICEDCQKIVEFESKKIERIETQISQELGFRSPPSASAHRRLRGAQAPWRLQTEVAVSALRWVDLVWSKPQLSRARPGRQREQRVENAPNCPRAIANATASWSAECQFRFVSRRRRQRNRA